MDLTFFTQTLPQLVEHIYNTAFTHSREKRDLSLIPGLTPTKGTELWSMFEQKDEWSRFTSCGSEFVLLCQMYFVEHVGAVKSAELDPPALFRDVGSSVDDWENYLRDVATDVEDLHPEDSAERQEDNLFLQVCC